MFPRNTRPTAAGSPWGVFGYKKKQTGDARKENRYYRGAARENRVMERLQKMDIRRVRGQNVPADRPQKQKSVRAPSNLGHTNQEFKPAQVMREHYKISRLRLIWQRGRIRDSETRYRVENTRNAL